MENLLASRVCTAALSICCLLLLYSHSGVAASGSYINVQELTTELKSQDVDGIIKALNTVKRMRYQGEILPFINDLWNDRREKHPDLPWKTIDLDIVKLELADILVQAQANGKISIETGGIHHFVVERIESPDVDVAQTAILVLAIIGDEKDVDRLRKIAAAQKPGTFKASIVALSEMCAPTAVEALDQLGATIKDSKYRTFIVDTKRQMRPAKELSWCREKS